MKLEQIEQVVEIAKHKSISQAASALFISQPSLSLSIQHLEAELGETIFIRTNKGVRLTPFGHEFVSYAEAILAQTQQLTNLLHHNPHRYTSKLSVASNGYRFVTDVCARLYQEYKGSNIEINIDDSINYDLLDLVADDLCEIGVTRFWSFQRSIVKKQMRQKNLQFFPLVQVPLTIVVGKGNPLFYSESNEVRREDLAGFPLLIYSYAYNGPYSGLLRESGIPDPTDLIIVNSRATNFEFMEKTAAYYISATPTPAYDHTDYYHTARSLRLADCNVTAEIGWIKNEARHLSPLANHFTRLLHSYFD